MLSRLNPLRAIKALVLGYLALKGGANVAIAAENRRYGPSIDRETGSVSFLNYTPEELQKLNPSCVYYGSTTRFFIAKELFGPDLDQSRTQTEVDVPAVICLGSKEDPYSEDFEPVMAIDRKAEGTAVHVDKKTGLSPDCESFVLVGKPGAQIGPSTDAKERLAEMAGNPNFNHAFFPRSGSQAVENPAPACEGSSPSPSCTN